MLNSLRETNRSLYDQAIDSLLNLIRNEQYQVGDKLPTEHQLSSELGISRTTLREAISHLERQGIVSRRHGVGTFVSIPAHHSLSGGLDELVSIKALAGSCDLNYERMLWQVSSTSASKKTADALLLNPGDPVTRVRMVISVQGSVFAYLDTFLPADFLDSEELRLYEDGSLLDFLLERQKVDVSHTYSKIHAVVADEEIARIMSMKVGTPLLHLIETYKSLAGHPIVHTYNYFGTEILNFYIIRRVVPHTVLLGRKNHELD
jgi:GntR family transcriptional regulator